MGVSWCFVAHHRSVHSYFGFVQFPLFFENDVRKFRNGLFKRSLHSFGVATSKSSPFMLYHYEATKREQITLRFVIKPGAKLIFVLEFKKGRADCNLYIDEVKDERRVFCHRRKPTWHGLGGAFVPAFSHHRGGDSDIEIKLLSHVLKEKESS